MGLLVVPPVVGRRGISIPRSWDQTAGDGRTRRCGLVVTEEADGQWGERVVGQRYIVRPGNAVGRAVERRRYALEVACALTVAWLRTDRKDACDVEGSLVGDSDFQLGVGSSTPWSERKPRAVRVRPMEVEVERWASALDGPAWQLGVVSTRQQSSCSQRFTDRWSIGDDPEQAW